MIHPPTSSASSQITNAPGHRCDPRFRVRLPMTLWAGRERYTLVIEDVSASGLYVAGDAPLRTRQLIRLETVLPPHDRAFVAHGMAVHTIPDGNPYERVPGFGIQLYALGREARGLWAEFIAYVRSQRGELFLEDEILFDEPLILDPDEPS